MADYIFPYESDKIEQYLAKSKTLPGETLGTGVYADGLSFTSYSQYLNDGGVLYKLNPSIATPYTTNTATYPSAASDPNLFEVDETLKLISLSLNVSEYSLIRASNTTRNLDDAEYIYDASNETIWSKPIGVQAGDVIVSVVGDQLEVTSGTYTMYKTSDINPYTMTLAQAKANVFAKLGDTKEISDRGNGKFEYVTGESANGFNIIDHDTLAIQLKLVTNGFSTLEQLGAVDQAGFQFALNLSNSDDIEISGKASFALTDRIDLPQKFKFKSNKGDVVITADASYFSGSEFAMIFGDSATAIADSYMEGVKCIGGLLDFNDDGIDRYGILIEGSVNTSVRYSDAETLERGIIIRNGATGGELAYNEAKNCYDQGVGYMGTSLLPISDVELHHNFAFTEGFTTERKMSGIRVEEVYDSNIYKNKARKCGVGHRWENSGDNDIYGNRGWENDLCGGELYNKSQRNTVRGNHFWDNNVSDANDTSLTPDNKGNAGTKVSGLNVENDSSNNTITGNICYQTEGGIGHQKYGIGLNIRNLTGMTAADTYNIVTGNQCFNNELGGVEDRGFGNLIENNLENDFWVTIIRNV